MYQTFWTEAAKDDLIKLYSFLLGANIKLATTTLKKIKQALPLLAEFPFSCKKITDDATLRELLISFGSDGYVLLSRIKKQKLLFLL